MAIDIPLELDSGPITWVKAEIDSALYRALESIEKMRAAPSPALRNAIQVDLHQVAGAFELVGIEGLAVLVQEFERHFTADGATVSKEALDLVDRGCRRLLSHLKEMASGSPPVPLRFIPEYLALGKLHNAKYGPADLFFPDLSRRPARVQDAVPPEPSRMPAFLLRQRRDFQQGLLQWLRGSEAGLDQMRRVIADIEAAYPLPSQRSFWWSAHALVVATQTGMVEPSTALKQLLARIDLQVRRFVEGSTRVADRLRREVLYHVARARSGNPLVDEVKNLYELDVLVPKRIPREIDVVALQPAITALSAIVGRCKDAWTSFNAGRSNAFSKLREATGELPAACDALHMPEFSSLGRGIANAAMSVGEGKTVGDDLSIEFATSLILIETALEHIAALPSSFRTQVERALQRLHYATTNAPIPVELRAENEDNSLTRLAQERQTISQVAKEIRANMRLVEQALDAVFRDRGATEELKPLPALLGQVSGAMRMLGWNDANELLTKTSDRLIDSVRNDSELSAQDIDSLADVLAGLSFYIDVRERRDRDADEILVGLKRRFLGEDGGSAESMDDESVEAALAERQRMLRPLARAINEQPDQSGLRETLRSTLQGVRQDAELLSDPGLSHASSEALRLLDSHDAPSADLSAAVAAVAAVVGSGAVLPPTSAETSRLVESQPEERDSALLDIFVEEATEVAAGIRANYAELTAHHARRDVLVDIRRAFHTLKGSGRMVGQTDLAEVAWRVERVLNVTLEEEHPATEAELRLIGAASDKFSAWIDALQANRTVTVDVTSLDDLIAQCGHKAPAVPVASEAAKSVESAVDKREELPSAVEPTTLAATDLDALLVTAQAPDVNLEPLHDSLLPLIEVTSVDDPEPLIDELAHTGVESVPDVQDDELRVLGVTVSRALFAILTDETRVHLQTLEYELTLMQFDTALPPSDAMVRASHTLCGIHRTAGFLQIGDFAGLLEGALMAVRRTGRTPQSVSTFASAIQCLRTATLRLQAQSPLSPEEVADQDRTRTDLQSLIAETGNRDLGVEVELIEQTHAEEQALAIAAPEPAAAVTALASPPSLPAEPAIPASMAAAPPASDSDAATTADVVTLWPAPGAVAPVAVAPLAPVLTTTGLTAAVGLGLIAPDPAPTADAATPPALAPLADVRSIESAATFKPTVAVEATADKEQLTTPTGISVRVATPSLVAPDLKADQRVAVPTRVTPKIAEDPLAEIRDDIDDQVLPIFIEEAQELYPRASEQVTGWRRSPHDGNFSDGLKRTLHTLKGSARMAGAMRLGELAHNFETRLVDVSGAPTTAVFDSFDEYLDDIAYLLERLTRGEKDVVLPRYQPKADDDSAAIEDENVVEPIAEPAPVPGVANLGAAQAPATVAKPSVAEIAKRLAARPVAAAVATSAAAVPDAAAFLRVRSDSVEQLSDEAGEIAIARSRIEAEMRNLKGGLLDLTASVVRLRGQLREIEIQGESQIQSRLDQESQFDPLEFDRYTRFQELTRGLAEGVNDVATVQQSLLKNLADAENALSTQTRLSRSVQLRLQTLRTVPFTNVSDRLYRTLRQTAKDLKKRANLDIRGGRIELDRSVLERLTPVLEHLVRNALAHGIESEQIRHDRSKSEIGEITLTVRQQGNEVAISLADDGGGIPLDKVRERAVAHGLIGPDESVSESQLLEFIFQAGFSTADVVTAVAGRGVGMDVVRNEVTALGGRVEAHTITGVGTTFTLSVPLTLAVTQVLLVGVGKAVFGIPSSIIDQVRQVPARERAAAAASGALQHAGQGVVYRSLGALTRVPHDTTEQRTAPVMVLRSGDLMAAVEVDRIIGNQEVVAKPYGPQMARVPGLAGLTVLADGTITLLLNPINLVLSQETDATRRPQAPAPTAAAPAVPPAATVVADIVTPVAEPTPDLTASAAAFEMSLPSRDDAVVAAQAPVIDEVGAGTTTTTATATAAPAVAVTPIVPLFAPPPLVAVAEPRVPVVLVVDDSLTVRKITTRLLEREGYRALTAKDGLDALQVLADNNPDVILLDIEMPRMDGFEFTKTLKADNRQSNIPIIMITSRTAEKHRSHAMELGVNEYLGKPYQDDQLLGLIAKYAGKPA